MLLFRAILDAIPPNAMRQRLKVLSQDWTDLWEIRRLEAGQKGLRLYRTGLFEMGEIDELPPPYKGRGWRGLLRPLTLEAAGGRDTAEKLGHSTAIMGSGYDAEGARTISFAPELLLEAPSRLVAQRALNLISAAKVLVDGGPDPLFDGEMQLALPDNPGDLEDLRLHEVDAAFRGRTCTVGYTLAAAIAAKASHRKKWTIALAKQALSSRYCAIHSLDLSPSKGLYFTVAKDPFEYLAMSHAIFVAFSAIEDLGMKLDKPAKDAHGKWNPDALAWMERKLSSNGLDPDGTTIWHLRGTPTRIERLHAPPPGGKTAWAVGPIRDRKVRLPDAIHYAQTLRNKVCGHAVKDLTRSLTVIDVVNVRDLLRRIILEGLGFWHRLLREAAPPPSGPEIRCKAVGEWPGERQPSGGFSTR